MNFSGSVKVYNVEKAKLKSRQIKSNMKVIIPSDGVLSHLKLKSPRKKKVVVPSGSVLSKLELKSHGPKPKQSVKKVVIPGDVVSHLQLKSYGKDPNQAIKLAMKQQVQRMTIPAQAKMVTKKMVIPSDSVHYYLKFRSSRLNQNKGVFPSDSDPKRAVKKNVQQAVKQVVIPNDGVPNHQFKSSSQDVREYGAPETEGKEVILEPEYYTPSPEDETDCEDMPKLSTNSLELNIDDISRTTKEYVTPETYTKRTQEFVKPTPYEKRSTEYVKPIVGVLSPEPEYYTPPPEDEADCEDMPKLITDSLEFNKDDLAKDYVAPKQHTERSKEDVKPATQSYTPSPDMPKLISSHSHHDGTKKNWIII